MDLTLFFWELVSFFFHRTVVFTAVLGVIETINAGVGGAGGWGWNWGGGAGGALRQPGKEVGGHSWKEGGDEPYFLGVIFWALTARAKTSKQCGGGGGGSGIAGVGCVWVRRET